MFQHHCLGELASLLLHNLSKHSIQQVSLHINHLDLYTSFCRILFQQQFENVFLFAVNSSKSFSGGTGDVVLTPDPITAFQNKRCIAADTAA